MGHEGGPGLPYTDDMFTEATVSYGMSVDGIIFPRRRLESPRVSHRYLPVDCSHNKALKDFLYGVRIQLTFGTWRRSESAEKIKT